MLKFTVLIIFFGILSVGCKEESKTAEVPPAAQVEAVTNSEPMALTKKQAKKLLSKSGCLACHSANTKKHSVGPAYRAVAKRYRDPSGLAYLKGKTPLEYLQYKVRVGSTKGGKNWKKSPKGRSYGVMTPNPKRRLSDENLKALIQWILSL